MNPLEKQFDAAMKNIYKQAKAECGYNATYFLRMLGEKGGLQTARHLLRSSDIQYGFTELWQHGLLRLTVEAHVLKTEFAELFTEGERKEAASRLRNHGYEV